MLTLIHLPPGPRFRVHGSSYNISTDSSHGLSTSGSADLTAEFLQHALKLHSHVAYFLGPSFIPPPANLLHFMENIATSGSRDGFALDARAKKDALADDSTRKVRSKNRVMSDN